MVADVAVPVHLIASLNFLIASRYGAKALSTQEVLDLLCRMLQAEDMRSARWESAFHATGVRNQNPYAI